MGLFGSKELIGLDIGSSSVKMAHVKAVGAENRLRKFGRASCRERVCSVV